MRIVENPGPRPLVDSRRMCTFHFSPHANGDCPKRVLLQAVWQMRGAQTQRLLREYSGFDDGCTFRSYFLFCFCPQICNGCAESSVTQIKREDEENDSLAKYRPKHISEVFGEVKCLGCGKDDSESLYHLYGLCENCFQKHRPELPRSPTQLSTEWMQRAVARLQLTQGAPHRPSASSSSNPFEPVLSWPLELENMLNRIHDTKRGVPKRTLRRLPVTRCCSATTKTEATRSALDATVALGSTNCPICFNFHSEGDLIVSLSCFHRFHLACVLPWLCVKKNCPSCRCVVSSVG